MSSETITTATEVTPVDVGDPVLVVDEYGKSRIGLVTIVHGAFGGTYTPCINVVFVSRDATRTDPYGRQIDRLASLQHYSAVTSMPQPARYWINL